MLRSYVATGGTIALWLYVLLGPTAWLTLWTLMLLGRSRMNRLTRVPRPPLPAPAPRVSVLVPARNEAGLIRECVRRLLSLDYPNYELLVIDDRSTDHTPSVLDSIASEHPNLRVLSEHPNLRVLHIRELPRDWMGKPHALHAGVREIDPQSEWLLFVDSDVNVEPQALSDAIALAVTRKYDALSILTRLECHTFLERLVLPLAATTWMVMFAASLTNQDSRTNIALANGQFFLIRRSAYEAVGGHESVRDQIVEDVELMRKLKLASHCVRFQKGTHLASTRMHTNLRQMLDGWSRIYAGTARRRPTRLIAAIVFILACGWSVYGVLVYGAYVAITSQRFTLLWLAIAHFVLMTALLAVFYRGSGNRMRETFLFPASSAFVLRFLVAGLRACRSGDATWRGERVRIKS